MSWAIHRESGRERIYVGAPNPIFALSVFVIRWAKRLCWNELLTSFVGLLYELVFINFALLFYLFTHNIFVCSGKSVTFAHDKAGS